MGGSFPHFWIIRLRIINKSDRKGKMKEKRGENERREKMRKDKMEK